MQHDDQFARATGRIARLRIRAATSRGQWLTGALVFLVALALRLELEALPPADPFVTFYIAAMVITLTSGWRCAGFFAVLSGLSVWFFFLRLPAVGAGGVLESGTAPLVLGSFAVVAAIEIALCELLAWSAARLEGGLGLGAVPARGALYRRARTAALFVAEPVSIPSPLAEAASAMAAEARNRLDLFVRLDDAVLDTAADPADWARHMEAFCQAEVTAAGVTKPVCRVAGDARALDPDQRLAISLAIGDMARQATETRCAVFEVGLETDDPGRCQLDIRAAGCRAPRWELPGATPWAEVAHWLARHLEATLTVPAEDDQAIRLAFHV